MFEIYSQAQDLTHDSHITAPTDDIRYQFGPNVNYDYTHRSANTCNNFVEQFNNQLNNKKYCGHNASLGNLFNKRILRGLP